MASQRSRGGPSTSPTVITTKKSTGDDQRAAFRWLCQTDLYALCHDVLYRHRTPNLLSKTFHGPICDWMATTPYQENLYLFQRGSFKTAVLNCAKNFQRILQHPEIRILVASNKGDNAEEMLKEIQGYCTDPLILWAFPEMFEGDPAKYPEWTKSALTVKSSRRGRGSTVDTIGVTGELTSKHFDHMTFDDVVGKENSQTKDAREGVIDFYRKSRPLLDPLTSWGAPSTRDNIGTTWHYADLWAHQQAQKAKGMALGVMRIPCWVPCAVGAPRGADVPGFGWVQPTFPERWTIQALLAERAEMGSSDFAAQYLLDPVSADAAHFKRERVEIVDTHPPLDELWVAMTVDPAISVKSWSDYSGLVVGGFDRRDNLYLLEVQREKRDEHGLVRTIFDLHARYPMLRGIGFENVGFQAIYQSLITMEGERRGYFLPILPLARDTNTKKNIRIAGLQGPWEAGMIKALRSCRDLAGLLDEADKFRPDRESQHDDLLDATVDLYQIRRRPAQVEAPAQYGDPEVSEQRAFEHRTQQQRVAQGKGELDWASLRIAWHMHKTQQDDQRHQEASALGMLDREVMEMGR